MKTTHHAEFLCPGSLFSEDYHVNLDSRSIDDALGKFPPGAFGFRLYDIETRVGTMEDGEKISKAKRVNESGMFYPGGEVFDVEGVRRLAGDYQILISNMEGNGWARVVRTRRGNFQLLAESDVILPDLQDAPRAQAQKEGK